MKLDKIFEKYQNKELNLKGRNMGSMAGKFDHLTAVGEELEKDLYIKQYRQAKRAGDTLALESLKMPSGLTPKHRVLLELLENLYTEWLADKSPVTPMKVENGKVVLPLDAIHHALVVRNASQLEPYADMGIVASEWFGQLESENEGRFCAFLSKGFFKNSVGFVPPTPCKKGEMQFFIDENSDLWKKISKYDYFEYEHIKNTTPERIAELYPPEIIDLFDGLIEPLSPSGRNMRRNPKVYFMSWMAIPGGIPPQLIVGVQINQEDLKIIGDLSKLQSLFPNAVIFDENQQVYQIEKYSDKDIEKS